MLYRLFVYSDYIIPKKNTLLTNRYAGIGSQVSFRPEYL